MDEGCEKENEKLDFIDGYQTRRVQDLAEASNEAPPPPRFIHMESNRPAKDLPHCGIPVVDLSCLTQPKEGEKLRSALQTWGIFQAVGHGIPSPLLDEIRNINKLFFHQPMKEKQRYFRSGIMGYGNDKFQTEDQILDWSDRLYIRLHPKRERTMELCPDTPMSFRGTLDEYFEKTQAMLDMIVKASAKLLGLEEDSFSSQIGEDAIVDVRFNFYPHCSRPDLVFGIKPHADGSVITIVLQDSDVEGLQVLNDQLGWVNVPVVHDALIVNVGDQLEIMSNGEYRSPMHRVVTNSERERISIAMFYSAGLGQELRIPSDLLTKGKPRLYKNVNLKEYLELYFNEFYHGDRAINKAKV